MSSKKPSYIDSLFNIGFIVLLFYWKFATLRGRQKNERARGQIVLVVKSAVLDRGKVVVFCCFYRVTSTRDVWGRFFAIFTIF